MIPEKPKENEKTAGKKNPEVRNFALLIRQRRKNDGSMEMMVKSENQGIPDSEIILIVETWLEKVKETVRGKILGGFRIENKRPSGSSPGENHR